MYKAILSKSEKDLLLIFENLGQFIPSTFNNFLTKVWKGDLSAIVTFVVEWLKRQNGNWKDFKPNIKIKD